MLSDAQALELRVWEGEAVGEAELHALRAAVGEALEDGLRVPAPLPEARALGEGERVALRVTEGLAEGLALALRVRLPVGVAQGVAQGVEDAVAAALPDSALLGEGDRVEEELRDGDCEEEGGGVSLPEALGVAVASAVAVPAARLLEAQTDADRAAEGVKETDGEGVAAPVLLAVQH